MVIVNRGDRKELIDKIFHYKATNEAIGKIGCSQFIEFHEKNFNRNWRPEANSQVDMNKFIPGKKNKPNIVVSKVDNYN